jgi:hypothetical protein
MAKKSTPEISVNTGEIVEQAKKAIEARTKAAEQATLETDAKTEIAELARQLRLAEEDKGHYIGMTRITGEDLPPIRVEHRLENAGLDVGQAAELDQMFGAGRALLWERQEAVTEILDPQDLIDELKAQGKNPWDYLDIKVRKGMDHTVAECKAVTACEAYMPREGFLETLNNIVNTLSDEVKTWLSLYLDHAMKEKVVLGTAKAKS